MVAGRYYLTILAMMVIGAVGGTLIGALYGWAGHEVGWWLVGLVLGLIYGVIGGFAMADPA